MLKKSINDQLAFEGKYKKQLFQLDIMKNKANTAYMTRKNLLTKMISFENMSMIKNEVQVEEMQKLYHELEEQVQLIKSETLEMEYKLNIIQEDIAKKEKMILESKKINNVVTRERNVMIKDYLKENLKIIKIYQTLNVNSLKEIIEIFNNQQFCYQSNYNQFNNLNKEIVDLKIIFTTYERDLLKLERNIKRKEKKDMETNDYKADIDVVNLQLLLKELRLSIEEDIDKVAQTEKIFIKMKRDFNNHEKKISYIITCINFIHSQKYYKDMDKESSNSNVSKEKGSKALCMKTVNNLMYIKELIPSDNIWTKDSSKIIINNFK